MITLGDKLEKDSLYAVYILKQLKQMVLNGNQLILEI